MTNLLTAINTLRQRMVRRFLLRHSFDFWQSLGIHILPVHYYSQVPDTRVLKANYPTKSPLDGIDMNYTGQKTLLEEVFPTFQPEYDNFTMLDSPSAKQILEADTFVLPNPTFTGIDPYVYYCMIRHFKPEHILEVGSGNSTRLARMAVTKNEQGKITCIEPYPSKLLKRVRGIEIIDQRVEEVDFDIFKQLKANDILFIDSSHTVRMGGDVTHLFLDVLPKLQSGVIVHVHDIFLPDPYPESWYLKDHRFFMEQYLLQAYLIGNTHVEVLFANHFMADSDEDALKTVFPKALFYRTSGSFWLRIL
ncbi:MAG: class I SAM-dependent methyltransferase [Aggregatilineales bacterium]